MDYDSDDLERIVEAFFRAHEEVYPDEADTRAMLREEKMDKLMSDAETLMRYGPSVETIISGIGRDMRKRPSLKMTAPVTIRFCIRSIEKLAKIGGSFGSRENAPRPVDTAAQAELMSLKDEKQIGQKIRNYGFAALSMEERWRWHNDIRAWRETMGFSGPPPTDPTLQWEEPTLLRIARDIYHANRRGGARYVAPEMPRDQSTVRSSWPSIRAGDLTAAERTLAALSAASIASAAQEAGAKFDARSKKAFAPQAADNVTARGDSPPPPPLPEVTDPRVAEAARKIGRGDENWEGW